MKAGFRNTLTKSISGSASNFLSQLSGLLVIWAGAVLVLQGKLTIGQLIAFRILSGYVTGPILRLTTMSQNFQETALSLERISDIIDNPQEIEIIGKDLPPMPPIDGKVSFENINFKFSDRSKLILKNINFQIPSGSFVGVVGGVIAGIRCINCQETVTRKRLWFTIIISHTNIQCSVRSNYWSGAGVYVKCPFLSTVRI